MTTERWQEIFSYERLLVCMGVKIDRMERTEQQTIQIMTDAGCLSLWISEFD